MLDAIRSEIQKRGAIPTENDTILKKALGAWLVQNHFPQRQSDANRVDGRSNSVRQFVNDYLTSLNRVVELNS